MKEITIIEERTGIKYELINILSVRIESGCIMLFGRNNNIIASFPADKYAFYEGLK